MSITQTKNRIAIPNSLVAQLSEFRKRVWTIKMLEATGNFGELEIRRDAQQRERFALATALRDKSSR